MRSISRGFLTLSDREVAADPWSISLNGSTPLIEPVQLDDWSYFQTIEASISVVADVDSLKLKLGIGRDAVLGLVIVWTCSGTSLRGSSAVTRMEGLESSVQLELDGSLLRKDVRLECQVILMSPSARTTSAVAPVLPGAVLWSTGCAVKLEGAGARMPIIALPFSRHLVAASSDAFWWLRIDSSELSAPADSVLWLWLNDENPVIVELLNKPSSEKSKITARLMQMDLYRQLVAFGLSHEDFDLDADYEEGSLGAVVAAPIRLLNEGTRALKARFHDDPQRIEAELQARVGALHG